MKILKMFDAGIELPRRFISDRLPLARAGRLVVSDTSDQGRHRVMRVAKFTHGTGQFEMTEHLYDPELLWWSGDRFMLTGVERAMRGSQTVQSVQSWLCILDGTADDGTATNVRDAKRNAAALRN